jgi:hypothetical protein
MGGCISLLTNKLNNFNIRILDEMDNLKVGDVLVGSNGHERNILAIIDEMVALSTIDYHMIYDDWVSLTQLRQNYTLKGSEPEVSDDLKEAIKMCESEGYTVTKE